jgi:hypothetical protein
LIHPLTLALTDWADVSGHRKSAAIAADASKRRTIVHHLLCRDAPFSAKSAHKQKKYGWWVRELAGYQGYCVPGFIEASSSSSCLNWISSLP